jgi:hypothetical protein
MICPQSNAARNRIVLVVVILLVIENRKIEDEAEGEDEKCLSDLRVVTLSTLRLRLL